ncbi:MAG: hypothetical protein ABIN54_11035, partial [candidate division WOR-3 bacterium]
MIAIALLTLSGQGPEGAYIFKTDTPRPYQPFETLQPESLNVKLLGYVEDTTIFILDLAASEDGNYIYAACGDSGLLIYDISDPATPHKIGRIETDKEITAVTTRNNLLFYSWATGDTSFYIRDISEPANPILLGKCTGGKARHITLSGDYAFCSGSGNFRVINISDSTNPYFMSSFYTSATPRTHDNYDTLVFLLQTGYGDPSETTWVYILDVSDPTDIKEINRFWLPGGQMSCIAAWKDTFNLFSPTYGHIFLYVLGGIWADYIWDVTDPMNPELVWEGRTGFGGGYWSYLHSKFSYVSNILEVYDRETEPDGFYTVGYYRNSADGGKMIWTKG